MFEEDVQNVSLDAILKKPKAKTRPGRVKKIETEPRQIVEDKKFEAVRPKPVSGTGFAFQNIVAKAGKPIYKKKKIWWTIAAIIILLVLGAGGYKAVILGQRVLENNSPFSFFTNFGQLISSNDNPLMGEENGKINILLLGIGGEGHEGGTLTDTIILASLRPGADKDSPGEVALFSIPRDFIVKLPDGLDYRKINSAYAYGNLKEPEVGAKWAREAVEEWTGEEIPYYAVIDFAGFEQAIDDVGGIDVYIENSFTDSSYPDNRFGYLPTLSFKEGLEHMNGERALQYVRSRHGTNGEGSDFARSKRQQKILSSFKEKITQLRISTSLGTISRLLDTFSSNFKTNLQPWEFKRLYNLSKDIPQKNILPLSLDYDSGLICNEIVEETGAAVITVCPGTTKLDVVEFAQNRFDFARTRKESPTIEFQNSTKVNFLAQRVSEALKQENFQISTTNFPGDEQFDLTIIYDLSRGQKSLTLSYLKEKLGAVVSEEYPYPEELSDPKPDFVIVLGQDTVAKFPSN